MTVNHCKGKERTRRKKNKINSKHTMRVPSGLYVDCWECILSVPLNRGHVLSVCVCVCACVLEKIKPYFGKLVWKRGEGSSKGGRLTFGLPKQSRPIVHCERARGRGVAAPRAVAAPHESPTPGRPHPAYRTTPILGWNLFACFFPPFGLSE